jgi:NAD(P)-dependent dehydrogenase (short-subunit alcohol dehydrogenase family)
MRIVAVTGVAGGIGSATAVAFAEAGWEVVGVDLVEPAPSVPLRAFLSLDLGDAAAGDRLAAFVGTLPALDALVNAAAIQGTDTIVETEASAWDVVFDANARGPFLAMRACFPLLRSGRGSVVNIASVHAVATTGGAAPYAASKGALVTLTRAAALEWAPDVRVNAVLPGAVDTPMLRQGMQRSASADGIEAGLEALAGRTPLGRIGRPEEIAEAIVFLADGQRSSFITGQTLVVDGGALARLSTE